MNNKVLQANLVVFSIGFSILACAQKKSVLSIDSSYEQRILRSLEQAVDHTTNAMLDDNGMARGNYYWQTGKWESYEAAWHTGQAIYGLLEAYEVTQNPEALQTAKKAGDWWISLQFEKDHPFYGYLNAPHGNKLGQLINTTTIADGTPGMFRLTRVTGDTKYADIATNAGAWILDNLYIPEQRLSYNIVDPLTAEIWKDKSPHPQHQGLEFDIKHVARPNAEGFLWLDMFYHTGEERYKTAFLELCDKLVEDQSPSGFWMDYEPNDPKTGKVHARFNTWNAEALIEAYKLSKDKKYLNSAEKTGDALARVQDKTGVIWYSSYLNGNHDLRSPCGSGASFAGIVWLQLRELGVEKYEENIKKALDFTLNNQFSIDHADENLAGAYYGIRQRSKKDGTIELYYRDITTAFGLRFLSKVYQLTFK